MSASGQHRLAEYCSVLRRELGECIIRRDDPDPRNRFVPNGATQDVLKKEKLVHLFELVEYEVREKFLASQTSRLQSHTDFLQSLAYTINPVQSRSRPFFCNVLAILIYAHCDNEWETLRRFKNSLKQKSPISDNGLPCTKSRACEAFGALDGETFWEHQLLFCPVTLKANAETICEQPCPLPFSEEPVKIGEGNSAKVYEVKIARGHLVNEKEDSANLGERQFAWKRYKYYDADTKAAFKAEWEIVKTFLEVDKTHGNILQTRASLERDGKYSLFFDLAKYDLWKYFHDPAVSVSTLEQRKAIFGRTIGIAGALTYLHTELHIASTGLQLCCYHLDLKPENILVFVENGNEIWKISDFGISKITPFSPGQASDHRTFLNPLLRARETDSDPSYGVRNPRDGGTYTAPEAENRSEPVSRASDVWSLGCIIALVLTFLDNRGAGIKAFGEARSSDKPNDSFFDTFQGASQDIKTHVLRPAVSTWLQRMVEKAKARNVVEGSAVNCAAALLLTEVLLPIPHNRLKAGKVEEKLKEITSGYISPMKIQRLDEDPVNPLLKPCTTPTSQRRRSRYSISGRGSSKEQGSFSLPFTLPASARSGKFSQDGIFLGIQSPNAITVIRFEGLQQEDVTSFCYKPLEQETWEGFSLGSRRLCAISNSQFFKCSYILLSPTGVSVPHVIDTSVRSSINRVVLSPEDEFTAFVLDDLRQGVKTRKLVLYRTEDVLSTPAQSDPRSARASTRPSHAIHPANTLSDRALPWSNMISNPDNHILNPEHPILDMKFSHDSRTLIMTTRVYSTTQFPYEYDVHVWDVASGQKHPTRQNQARGFDNMSKTWKINAFTVFPEHPVFAGVTTKKIYVGFYPIRPRPAPRTHFVSSTTSDEFLDIVDTESAKELIVLGKKDARGTIKVFHFDGTKITEHGIVKAGLDTGLHAYDPAHDCCRLIQDTSNGTIRRAVLIASIIGRDAGKLSISHLS